MLNGVHFRKGALVALLFATVHYDPNIWTDPEVFNPDRYILSVCCPNITDVLITCLLLFVPYFILYQVILFFVHLQVYS